MYCDDEYIEMICTTNIRTTLFRNRKVFSIVFFFFFHRTHPKDNPQNAICSMRRTPVAHAARIALRPHPAQARYHMQNRYLRYSRNWVPVIAAAPETVLTASSKSVIIASLCFWWQNKSNKLSDGSCARRVLYLSKHPLIEVNVVNVWHELLTVKL